MEKNDRYNLLKELLTSGEKDKVILAKKVGYTGATDKRLKDSLNRFLNNHLELKQLLKDLELKNPRDVKKESNYKNNELAPSFEVGNLKTFEDLVKVSDNNPVIKILTNEIINLKNDISNQNKYKEEHQELFLLDEKYKNIDQDDIIPVSLRMTREAKKKLDKFSKENSTHKKIHIVSQMIEEFVNKYS